MRPKDEMLIDCAAIDQAYTYLTKPEHLASVRVAGDVVELLTALEASGTEIERLQTELDAKSDKLELAEFWWGQSADEARARALELVHGNNRLYDRCVDAVEERDEAREWANRRTRTANELYGCNTKLYNKAGDASKWTAVLSDEVSSLRSQLATASNDLRTQLTSALLEREQGLRPTFAGVRDAYDTTVDIAVRARAQRDGARNGALDEAAERAHKILYNTCTAFRFADRVAAEIRALKSE